MSNDMKQAEAPVAPMINVSIAMIPPKLVAWVTAASLAMTFITTMTGVIACVLFTFAPGVPATTDNPPQFTGDKNDFQRLNYYNTAERHRQQIQLERKTNIAQSVAQLAGAAFIFMALTLFLIAAGRCQEKSDQWQSTCGTIAIAVSGIVAVTCGTMIFAYTLPSGVAPGSFVPPMSFGVQQAFAP
jgi:hypothetical protein